MKVLSVLGTRPEAIKMAPVIRELEKYPGDVEAKVCVTGQHRQMLDQMLALFNVTCDYDLNLMQRNQSLSRLTARALAELDAVIGRQQPDWVLVQGDTTTAMVASLVAFSCRKFLNPPRCGQPSSDDKRLPDWLPWPWLYRLEPVPNPAAVDR